MSHASSTDSLSVLNSVQVRAGEISFASPSGCLSGYQLLPKPTEKLELHTAAAYATIHEVDEYALLRV